MRLLLKQSRFQGRTSTTIRAPVFFLSLRHCQRDVSGFERGTECEIINIPFKAKKRKADGAAAGAAGSNKRITIKGVGGK